MIAPGRPVDLPDPLREQWRLNKFLWLCLGFLAVFIPLAQARHWITASLPVCYAILGAAALNAALRTYCGWKYGGNSGARSWFFTCADVFLISVGVYLSGGILSELWLAYFVTLIAESLFATRAQTNGLVAIIVAAYVGATWSSRGDADYGLTIATRLFFLLVVGYFARQMSGRRERKSEEVRRLSEQVAASEERGRIAREVHDGLGHALVAAILRLELCSRIVRTDPEEAERILREEVPALRAAWSEGRDLAFHLRPWEPDALGLAQGLRRHIGRFAERTGLSVDLQMEGDDWNVPPQIEMALTRIVQEALTNVSRHSHATTVRVALRKEGTLIKCGIEDDGVGFAAGAGEGGYGLYGMRDRSERLGGAFTVRSAPGEGVRLQVTLPCR